MKFERGFMPRFFCPKLFTLHLPSPIRLSLF